MVCFWVRVVTEALLRVEHLSKRFGGIVASDAVSYTHLTLPTILRV